MIPRPIGGALIIGANELIYLNQSVPPCGNCLTAVCLNRFLCNFQRKMFSFPCSWSLKILGWQIEFVSEVSRWFYARDFYAAIVICLLWVTPNFAKGKCEWSIFGRFLIVWYQNQMKNIIFQNHRLYVYKLTARWIDVSSSNVVELALNGIIFRQSTE